MATRLYLPSSGTAPLPSLAFDSNWERSNGAVRLPCSITKSNTALSDTTLTWASATTAQWVWYQFQSEPMSTGYSWTTADTISMVIRCLEGSTACDDHLAYSVRVVSADGSTVRGTIGLYHATSTEFSTSALTRIHSARTTGASTFTSYAGDRIIIEIGIHGVTPSTAYTQTMRVGDPSATSDFALTAGLSTDLCPWIELSRDVTFGGGNLAGSIGMESQQALFFDDFNTLTANQPLEGQGNWIQQLGSFQVVTDSVDNGVQPNSNNELGAIYNVATEGNNQYVQATLVQVWSGYATGIGVRMTGSSSTSCGYGYIGGSGQAILVRMTNGVQTTLGSTGNGWVADDVIRLEIEGNVITAYKNGSIDTSVGNNGSYTDSTYGSGYVGLMGYAVPSTGNVIFDWEGGDLEPIVTYYSTTVSGTLSEAVEGAISGTTGGIASVSGILLGVGVLSGSIVGGSTVGGDLGEVAGETIFGIADGISSVSGILQAKGQLTGAIPTSIAISGTLIGLGLVAGSSSGVASVSGIILAKGELRVTLSGVATLSGILGGNGELKGVTSSISSVAGILYNATPSGTLVGTINSTSSVTSVLKGKGTLIGSINGVATLSGILGGNGELKGVTSSISSVSCLSIKLKDGGLSSGVASVSGILKGSGKLQTTLSGVASVSGDIRSKGGLVTVTNGVTSITGVLKGKGKLYSTINGVADCYATPKSLTPKGTINGVASASGILNGKGRLITSTTGVTSITGVLKGKGKLYSTINGVAICYAKPITARGSISGTALVSGILGGKFGLVGQSTGVGVLPDSILLGRGKLIGEINTQVILVSILLGKGQLSGELNGISDIIGYIREWVPPFHLTARIYGITNITGSIRDRGSIVSDFNGKASIEDINAIIEDDSDIKVYLEGGIKAMLE